MKHLSSFAIALTLLFSSALAAAQVNPVYVVDVKGLDAARVRVGVGRELHGDAVAPDDPRAKDAAGHVTIETKDGKATVTYRKLGAPVSRTVDLPADAPSAESTAVLLAGNLARDEAGELLDGLKKPAPPAEPAPPKHVSTDYPPTDEEIRQEQIKAIFKQNEEDQRQLNKVVGFGLMGAGAALAAPGVYFLASNGVSDEAEKLGLGLTVLGGVSFALGAAALVIGPEDTLAQKMEQKRLSSGEAIELWQKEAESARVTRRWSGAILLGTGLASIATGSVILAVEGPRQSSYVSHEQLYALGAFFSLLGLVDLAFESPVETSWRTWQVSHPPPTVSRPQVGLAPLPGGAYGTLQFSF